jgi:hypothetical protein
MSPIDSTGPHNLPRYDRIANHAKATIVILPLLALLAGPTSAIPISYPSEVIQAYGQLIFPIPGCEQVYETVSLQAITTNGIQRIALTGGLVRLSPHLAGSGSVVAFSVTDVGCNVQGLATLQSLACHSDGVRAELLVHTYVVRSSMTWDWRQVLPSGIDPVTGASIPVQFTASAQASNCIDHADVSITEEPSGHSILGVACLHQAWLDIDGNGDGEMDWSAPFATAYSNAC